MSVIHSKRYRSLLSGLVFSRFALAVLVLRLFLARNDFDLASFTGHCTGALLVMGVIAFFEYDSLPSRFWFDSEVLCVEDTRAGLIGLRDGSSPRRLVLRLSTLSPVSERFACPCADM